MNKFGIKEIDIDNWMEPDHVLKGFVRITPNGKSKTLDGNDYVKFILKPRLTKSVPEEVQILFEVARGAMVYGYFFYPLYSLASEQLFRVAESAVTYKCKKLNSPKLNNFNKKIEWLVSAKIIQDEEFNRWGAIRHLRNSASHPQDQIILSPNDAIGMMADIAEQINNLFRDS